VHLEDAKGTLNPGANEDTKGSIYPGATKTLRARQTQAQIEVVRAFFDPDALAG